MCSVCYFFVPLQKYLGMTKTKLLLFVWVLGLLLVACNDGDLEVEKITFDNTDLHARTDNDINATVLFKTNGKQALILEMPAGVLKYQEGTVTGTIPNPYKLYYRTFNGDVGTDYFRATVPPATPITTSNIEATGGEVTIVSKAIYNETSPRRLLRYDHQITISNLVIVNADGNKVIDSNYILGTYQTATSTTQSTTVISTTTTTTQP